MQALEAGDIAFRSEPTLEQYLHFAPIAGTWWPEHRARLHGPLILKACSVSFLQKHLFDNAIAVLKTTMRYTLLAQVVDATLEEQTALDWVIQALPTEHIMNDLLPGSGSLAYKSTYGLEA